MNFEVNKPPQTGITVNASDFGLSPKSDDNFDAFNRCLTFCRDNDADVLIIPEGIYYFNNQNTLCLDNCNNLYIIAEKAEFRYVNTTVFWKITNCSSIHIKGLTIDWNWEYSRLASAVRVKGISPNKDYVDFYSLDGEIDVNIPWTTFNTLDAETMTVGCENGMEFHPEYPNGREYFTAKEKIDNDIYRCYGDFNNIHPLFFQKDCCYLIRHHMYDGYMFSIDDSSHISFDSITVYSGSGIGFLVKGHSHHLHFDKVKVAARENRKLSFIADIFHSEQSNGYFLFENCEFAHQGDDSINIHDNVHLGIEKNAPDTFTIVNNSMRISAGDMIEFRKSDLSPYGFSAEITEVHESRNAKTIKLNCIIPENISDDCIIFNRSYGSDNYIIRNCYFHDHRARGILAQANNGLIENCTFSHIQGAAIQIETGASTRWSEGMGVNNLKIRNNKIINCDINDWGKGVIYMSSYIPRGIPAKKLDIGNPASTMGDGGVFDRTNYTLFTNITIENNIFEEFPRFAMILTSFKNVSVTNNKFINCKRRKVKLADRGKLWISMGSNFMFSDNEFIGKEYTPNSPIIYDK